MDTVSMSNKMRFYCQPILPLVYEESISYYETLCKVVGQLNTTGDAVNKLNEGLTGEIADRQAADAELDERLKLVESTNAKIHFLVFVGANPNSAMPTRTELWNWVRDGDIICVLYSANDTERGDVYAASCTYNAGNWETENSSDFHFIIPLETTYDSTGKLAVKQKIAKLTIPSYSKHVLTVPWGEEIIEINTPHTSAEGIVNFSATVDNKNTVHANLSPAEFTSLYRAVSKGSGLIVGVNAQLTTSDSQLLLSMTADIIGGETASDDEVRIVFDGETSTGERGLGLPYLTRVIYILAGSGTDETWTITGFQTRDFAFDRDEGFQFTRAANNVITPSFGSTPKEVAEYFGTVKGGDPYQNLPVRLIDNVDNAEYWNGVFHRKSDGRISYTFTTSYYRESKMLVRIIELSATPKSGSTFVGDEKWVYAAKEFELPLENATQSASGLMSAADKTKLDGIEVGANKTVVDAELSSTSTNPVQNKVVKAALGGKFDKTGGKIEGNAEITGFLNVGMSAEFSSSIQAQSEITSDLLLMAPIVALHDPAAEKTISLGVSGENAAKVTSTVSGGGVQYARLKVASPTEDNDAATKKYVDDLSASDAITYVDFWGAGQSEVYDNGLKAWTVSLGTDKTFDYIFDLISSGANVVARLYRDSTKAELVSKSMEANISGDKTLGFINFLFMHAADAVAFGFPTIADAVWVTKTSAGTSAYALYKWCALSVPAGDGTDNGKVPIINGTQWELKTLPTYANGNEVSY